MKNKNLHAAKKNKNDEFYTQLTDIEKELKHYKKHFKGKTVLCNCDDPYVSNFFHYFSYNFEHLDLKKLITTCYKNQQKDLFSKHDTEKAIYLEYEGDKNGNNIPDPEEIGIKQLKGNGDFRSKKCIELLKEADIVVTNPPFSLFRGYLAQLIEYDKKFLIIGNMNAITYKEIFPLIKENKLWLGVSPRGMSFVTTGDNIVQVNSVWFTNLLHEKRNKELILFRDYHGHEDEYPKYDNYDAINVGYTKNIPRDFEGIMGVPITFLDKYNSNQFEILWLASGHSKTTMPEHIKKEVKFDENIKSNFNTSGYGIVDGKQKYHRILIKRR